MTRFTFDDLREPEREHVASVFLFDGGPQFCLVMKTADPERFLWMYEDGDTYLQDVGLDGVGCEEPIKKFYRGDSITITF
jgi:hypothetical protein